MSPQRQGNENFPPGSVQPPAGQDLGLTYAPWYAPSGFKASRLSCGI